MPGLPPGRLVDRAVTLPPATGGSFRLAGATWEVPGPDTVDAFVDALGAAGVLAQLLLGAGLVDELQWWIHPQLVGPADTADLLSRPGTAVAFELVDSRVMSNGIILAIYRP